MYMFIGSKLGEQFKYIQMYLKFFGKHTERLLMIIIGM